MAYDPVASVNQAKAAVAAAMQSLGVKPITTTPSRYVPYSGPAQIPGRSSTSQAAAKLVGQPAADKAVVDLAKAVQRAQGTLDVNHAAGKIDDNGYADMTARLTKIAETGQVGSFGDAAALASLDPENKSGHGALDRVVNAGSDVIGKGLDIVSRPFQAVAAGVAQSSREGEANPIDIGPLSLRMAPPSWEQFNKAAEAFTSGGEDSPMSIAKEAGDIRAKQGQSTKSFGLIPGTDLRSDPLGPVLGNLLLPGIGTNKTVRNLGFDIVGSAALDPLTYLSFGLEPAAKAGYLAAQEVLGADKANMLLRNGLRALSDADKEALAAKVPQKVMDALERGAQGGVKVRLPHPIEALKGGHVMDEGHTIIPSKVFEPAKAAVGALAELPVGKQVAGALRGVRNTFVPRSEILHMPDSVLGERAAEMTDKFRTAVGAGAASDTQAAMDRVIFASREAKVASAEGPVILRALEAGDRASLEPRLQPVYDAFDKLRQEQAARDIAAGRMPSPLDTQTVRDSIVASTQAKLDRTVALRDKIVERLARRTEPLVAAEPKLKGVTERLGAAHYAGGRTDVLAEQAAKTVGEGTTAAGERLAGAQARLAGTPGLEGVVAPSTRGVEAAGGRVERGAVAAGQATGAAAEKMAAVEARNTAEAAKLSKDLRTSAAKQAKHQAAYDAAIAEVGRLASQAPDVAVPEAEIRKWVIEARKEHVAVIQEHANDRIEQFINDIGGQPIQLPDFNFKPTPEMPGPEGAALDNARQILDQLATSFGYTGERRQFFNPVIDDGRGNRFKLFTKAERGGSGNLDVVLSVFGTNLEGGNVRTGLQHEFSNSDIIDRFTAEVAHAVESKSIGKAMIEDGIPPSMALPTHELEGAMLSGPLDQAVRDVMEMHNEGRLPPELAQVHADALAKANATLDSVEQKLVTAMEATDRAKGAVVPAAERLGRLEADVRDALDMDLRAAGVATDAGNLRGGGFRGLDTEGRKFYDALVAEAKADVRSGRLADARTALSDAAEALGERAAARGYTAGERAGRAQGAVTAAESGLRGAERAVGEAQAAMPRLGAQAQQAAQRADLAAEQLGGSAMRTSEQSLERGRKLGTITTNEQARIARLDAIKADLEEKLAAAKEQAAKPILSTENYVPRVLTPEGRVFERGADQGVRHMASSPRTAMLDPFTKERRVWEDFATGAPAETIDAINAITAEKVGANLFTDNPWMAFATRELASRKAEAGQAFFHDLLDLHDVGTGEKVAMTLEEAGVPHFPDRPVIDTGKGRGGTRVMDDAERERYIAAHVDPNFVPMKLPAVAEKAGLPEWIVVRKEIANELGKYAQLMGSPGELAKLDRFLNSWQGLWKGYATVPLPFGFGFHMRNAQGNMMLNWLAGVRDMRDYGTALRLQRLMRKGVLDAGDSLHYLSGADRALAEEALKRGIIREGFFSVDLANPAELVDTLGRQPVKWRSMTSDERKAWLAKRGNPLNQQNALIDFGRKFGSAIEDNARLANFAHFARTTEDFDFAASQVRKWLFDYGDLSAVDQRIKQFIPFWTFTRKSAPVVLEGFARNPYKLARIQEARRALASQAEPIKGPYPDYLRENLGTPLPFTPPGFPSDQPAVMVPDIPGFQALGHVQSAYELARLAPLLNRLPSTGQDPGKALNDLLQMPGGGPLGLASTGAQIALGQQFFNGTALDSTPRAAPGWALPFVGESYMTDPNTGELVQQPSMSSAARFFWEQNIPILPKLSGVPGLAGPGGEDKVPRRMFSTVTGGKVYPISPASQKAEAARLQQEVSDLVAQLKSQYGVGR